MKVRLRTRVVWDNLTQRNMSQNDLARRLGITSGYLSLLINGKRCPSPRLRERLQVELTMTFKDLFVIEHNAAADEQEGCHE